MTDGTLEFTPIDKGEFHRLKAEYSVVSPETENTHYKPLIGQIKGIISDDYATFLPPQALERNQGLEDRIIITDQKRLLQIYQEVSKGRRVPRAEPYAFTIGPEGIMVFGYDRRAWDEYTTEETRRELLEAFGADREAEIIEYYAAVSLSYGITHELLHQYHNPRLPNDFVEFGIPYYQNGIVEKLGMPVPNTPELNRVSYLRAEFYRILIENFGSDIHRVFFGTNFMTPEDVEPRKQVAILDYVRETAEKYYPELVLPK